MAVKRTHSSHWCTGNPGFCRAAGEELKRILSQCCYRGRLMPAIYALYVINKSGGLIYNKEFLNIASNSLNDTLRLASIWHSLHAIAVQLAPVPGCTGIELLRVDTFDLHCFQTLTGTKFLVVVEPDTPDVEALLRETVYDLYADFVLKNPFYEVEMPIRCELFDQHLFNSITGVHRRWGLVH